jgi:hypothetical protein
MLGHDRDHDGGIFQALALVNGRRVGRHQGVEFAEATLWPLPHQRLRKVRSGDTAPR